MNCPYKWQSRRSFFIILQASILKNDFYVLNEISLCHRSLDSHERTYLTVERPSHLKCKFALTKTTRCQGVIGWHRFFVQAVPEKILVDKQRMLV